MKVGKSGAFAALAMALLQAGCSQEVRGGEAVKSEVYVLVDLSRTWFNPTTEVRNRRVLGAVGEGAALQATEEPTPYLVQYRVIGNNSYLREPICSVVFQPGFRRDATNSELISRPNKLKSYLTGACVQGILSRPPEDLTQISAAIASVALEPHPSPNTRRRIIVISDFLEETAGAAPIPRESLAGTHVLLLYRPLAEDQLSPRGTSRRVEYWRERLEARGAIVQVSPDTSIRQSSIVSFLKQ